MRIIWSRSAEAELANIVEYAAADSMRAATELEQRIHAMVAGLADFPHVGRPSGLAGFRELVVSGSPYFVVYRINAGGIEIARVIHGARLWPPE